MIFLILGILFLAVGIFFTRYYKGFYIYPDEVQYAALMRMGYLKAKLFELGGCLVMLLDILGIVFILIFIIKKIT